MRSKLTRKGLATLFGITFVITSSPMAAQSPGQDWAAKFKAAQAKGDHSEMFRLAKPRAEAGSAYAQYILGMAYLSGNGTEPSDTHAAHWLHKAASQEQVYAQYFLGGMFEEQRGVAQFQNLNSAKDSARETALSWYKKAAEQGHAKAQFATGRLTEVAVGIPTPLRQTMAATWFRKSADQGNAKAQFKMGGLYSKGTGVDQSHALALTWTKKSADQNYAPAQINMGVIYGRGFGVAPSRDTAIDWFKKAAAQNDESAKRILKDMGVKYP